MEKNIRRDDWETLRPTVQRWGIVDVNYIIHRYATRGRKAKLSWVCPYYRDWMEILRRCFCPKLKKKSPTYRDCTVCDDWKYLSNFIKWVDSQPNRDWQNCALDKDFLILDNKHYGPETCVYISKSLNSFIITRGNDRGGFNDWCQ